MIIVILGGTCAGKTELALRLKKYGFDKVITNTTRSRRKDDSVNAYHFLTKEEFFEKVKNGEMLEYAEYNGNYYGTSLDSLSENCVIVLEPNGFRALKDKLGDKVFSIYLDVSDEERLKRGLLRGDNEVVLRERIEKDRNIFKGFDGDICDCVFKNSTLSELEKFFKEKFGVIS